MNDYGSINDNINQTMSYSNTLPIKNIKGAQRSPDKYFNYESRKTPQYKGKKIFKAQRYNPITDEYIQENINENNMTESTNVLVVQNNIQTPNNNLYKASNYNKSINQNNYIKEEFGTSPEIKENDINNKNEGVIQKESENQNQNQNYNLKENNSLIKFRNILKSQGTKSIFRFQRMLSIYDRKHSGLISFDNFYNIFKAYYANIPLEDIKSIFSLFDSTSNPKDSTEIKIISIFQIKYDDLLKSIIGNMPLNRQLIVKKVFDSFEKGSDGKIMTNDIKSKFNYNRHPDVLSGKNSAIEIYNDFLDYIETFREYNDNLKGIYSFGMNYDEFADFYNEISMYIEDDDYFEKLLKNCWNLEEENTDGNKNINANASNNNLNNSYQRSNQYNNQNIRMKTGSQIINNNIF
jgi:Ca2+-binding EF-hand superfamily protein